MIDKSDKEYQVKEGRGMTEEDKEICPKCKGSGITYFFNEGAQDCSLCKKKEEKK